MPVTMYHNPRCNTSRRPGSTTDDAQRRRAPITIRLRLELDQLTPALSIQQSLDWHDLCHLSGPRHSSSLPARIREPAFAALRADFFNGIDPKRTSAHEIRRRPIGWSCQRDLDGPESEVIEGQR
jgi:hypothetical protein